MYLCICVFRRRRGRSHTLLPSSTSDIRRRDRRTRCPSPRRRPPSAPPARRAPARGVPGRAWWSRPQWHVRAAAVRQCRGRGHRPPTDTSTPTPSIGLPSTNRLSRCALPTVAGELSTQLENGKWGAVGGSVAEWLACWTQAQKGPGSNRSRDAVG